MNGSVSNSAAVGLFSGARMRQRVMKLTSDGFVRRDMVGMPSSVAAFHMASAGRVACQVSPSTASTAVMPKA